MKKLFSIKLLMLVCLVMSLGILTSCEDDEAVDTGRIELLSFGPTGVEHGEEIRLIGRNLNKVDAVEFTGATVPKSEFVQQSSDLIIVVVPVDAWEGKITLKSAEGDVVSKTDLGFTVDIASATFSPEAVKPGENLTLTGDYLNFVNEVYFTGTSEAVTEFVSQTRTELVVTVPMTAVTGKVTLSDGKERPVRTVIEDVAVILPTGTAVSPDAVKHGEDLTITGTDLDLVQEVIFTAVGEGLVSTFVSMSETELVVTVPDNASSGAITLVTYSGVEIPVTEELNVILPAATALTPTPVEIGANLTITGTNLDLVREIRFPGVTDAVSDFVSQSATEIVVTVPEGAINGALRFITFRDYVVTSTVPFKIPGEGPAPLAYALYKDAMENGWQDWSNAADLANTENVFDGSKAIKHTFSPWGSFGGGFWPDAAPAGNYSEFTMWVYGGAGTDGKNIRLLVNPGSWDDYVTVTLQEGKWVEFTVQLDTFTDSAGKTDPATFSDIRIQAEDFTGSVWFDFIGFR
ncbi:hypothetical protein [Cesiribacter sp. SM1]|uniref:hypothetical protein n=1 Tax=Cesiribacter sp. SM1 TaxID=2861196 RepID=UPI001CD495FD|nr:hypothetical protein [Cesiribacter sp. SM1]